MAKEIAQHSDEELYRLLRDDRRAPYAFQELYDRYAARVFKYCRRVLGHRELAEDIFQETFVKFHESAAVERDMRNVGAYILRIARNLCLNAKSSKYYGLASLDDVHLSNSDPSYDERQLLEIIRSAVECLPIDFREAFVLREYDGFSYNDIAEVLGVPIATVKIRIYRAKQQLRKTLSSYLADLAQ